MLTIELQIGQVQDGIVAARDILMLPAQEDHEDKELL